MKENLVELEIKEVFETMRSFFTLVVQALSILAVANITVIGYAITTQTAGVLVVGVLIDFFTYFIMTAADAFLLAPVYYRAATLRKQLGDEYLQFFPSFFASYYRPSLVDELAELTKIDDLNVRTSRLRRLFLPSPKRFSKRSFLFSTFAGLQLVSIPILVNWFGWKML